MMFLTNAVNLPNVVPWTSVFNSQNVRDSTQCAFANTLPTLGLGALVGTRSSAASDESERPGEDNMWTWVLVLSYHYELGGKMLKAWARARPRVYLRCARSRSLLHRCSACWMKKVLWNAAKPCVTVENCSSTDQRVLRAMSPCLFAVTSSNAMSSKQPALFCEATDVQDHKPRPAEEENGSPAG